MNVRRRNQIIVAVSLLSQAMSIIETCRDDEQEYFDNMPEGLQAGEKGDAAQAAAEALDAAYTSIEEAIGSAEEAIGS